MTGHLYVGVDLGTQSVKVSIADTDGSVTAAASRPLSSIREGARHEQRPQEWLSATMSAMGSAIGSLQGGDRHRIKAVATCGTSGTIVLTDGHGSAKSAGIMYDDTRAAHLVTDVAAADPARWQRLGYRIQPAWAITKLVDLARSALPGDFLAHQPDIINASLTGGRVATDWNSALKSCYDVMELEWPRDAMGRLGVDAALLPEVVAPGVAIGTGRFVPGGFA